MVALRWSSVAVFVLLMSGCAAVCPLLDGGILPDEMPPGLLLRAQLCDLRPWSAEASGRSGSWWADGLPIKAFSRPLFEYPFPR